MKNLKDRNFERELPSGYTQAMHVNAKNAKFGIVFNVIAVAVLLVVMAAAFILLALCDKLSADVFAIGYSGLLIMIIECRNDYFRFDKPILSAFA